MQQACQNFAKSTTPARVKLDVDLVDPHSIQARVGHESANVPVEHPSNCWASLPRVVFLSCFANSVDVTTRERLGWGAKPREESRKTST